MGLALAREHDPDLRPGVPRATLVVAEQGGDGEAGPLEPAGHLRHRQRPKGERESAALGRRAAPFDEFLVEERQAPGAVLPDRLDQRDPAAAGAAATEADPA